MVTALAERPADGAVGSENDVNGNAQSVKLQNGTQIEEAVQVSKNPTDNGMKYTRILLFYNFETNKGVIYALIFTLNT